MVLHFKSWLWAIVLALLDYVHVSKYENKMSQVSLQAFLRTNSTQNLNPQQQGLGFTILLNSQEAAINKTKSK